MGREAQCQCRCGTEQGAVKALLESHEIILRGEIKRHIKLHDMSDVHTVGADLRFSAGAEQVVLGLGAEEAERWARKIATPPLSLRQKLGLAEDAKALVYGDLGGGVLADALHGAAIATPSQAAMTLAVVHDAATLAAGLAAHARLPAGRPLWIVHGKGRASVFGEAAVRSAMRGAGFIDTKVAAVSDDLTATRYSRS